MPDYPKIATPSQVWSEPTRTLSALTGQPRTDILGEDTTFEAGVGARKAKIDNVDAQVSTRALEVGGRLATIPAFVAATETSVLLDATEKTLIEITDVKSSEIEAWVDLTPMGAGDTIVVRYWRKMKSGGDYVKYAEETCSGTQSIPALCILNKKVYRDIKITAQQTLGTSRTLDVQIIRVKEA